MEYTDCGSTVSVVIVTWNAADIIDDCLDSLLTAPPTSHDAKMLREVIVVDNASTDGTIELVSARETDQRVKLVRCPSNLGFAPATNIGARSATSPLVLLLNPDARLTEGCLAGLVDQFNDPKVGICGPRIVRSDGSLDKYSARRYPTAGATFSRLAGLTRLPFLRNGDPLAERLGRSVSSVPLVTGAVMMIRRDALASAGFLDTTMPMYLEDLEIARACSDLGLEVLYLGTEVAEHYGAHTTSSADHRQLLAAMEDGEAPWTFILRRSGRAAAGRFRLAVLLGSLARIVGTTPARLTPFRQSAHMQDVLDRAVVLTKWATTSPGAFQRRVALQFAGQAPQPSPSVSVLIHNFNRASLLDACLASVAEQEHRPLEVVVHDAESSDDSMEVIARWTERFQARGIDARSERRALTGVATSRNALVEAATGELMYFLDNDAKFVDNGAVGQAARQFTDPRLALISARVLLRDGDEPDPWAWVFRRGVETWWNRSFGTFTFAGTGFCVRASAYRSVGGFWDALPYSWEEEELAFQLIDRGWRLRYGAETAIRHFPAPEGRLSPGQRRFVELRNGAMVMWRCLPLAAAVPAIAARTATMTRRAVGEGESATSILKALPAARSLWREGARVRAPVAWRTLARYVALHRAKKDSK